MSFSENINNQEEKVASDPAVREGIFYNLAQRGSASGSTFGQAVRQVRPDGASMNQSKKAMNSLTHRGKTTIQRTGDGSGPGSDRGGYVIKPII